MSYLDSNPRVSWANAFESGIRTQAAADLEEAGCQVQTSGAKSGGCYGDEYTPVYSAIRLMEREQPLLAAVGHWLSLADTPAANQHLDDVADAVLALYVAKTPEWTTYRKARKERVEALIQARMMQERNDMDGSRPLWQPLEVCFYCQEYMGVRLIAKNWIQDGWHKEWAKLGDILAALESEAMEPIYQVVKKTNRLYKKAA
ncbi:hypothetical protein ELY33_17115 [Vreelandella andesensis]|uniref:Uncharacterized protein n=1 Tax=Vreelandella andesensis TaxID=447567 RepID=A0A433KEX7_9GAMM|nr:hypothetical protein [Halomonas andesensis]RUR26828.1 hypothetical protein ELY33_17115 [Halomonas andesensis]